MVESTGTLDGAARELDVVTAAAEVPSSPDVEHPSTLWRPLVEAMPELLGRSPS